MNKENVVIIDKQIMNKIIEESLKIIDLRESNHETRNSSVLKIVNMIKTEVENEN